MEGSTARQLMTDGGSLDATGTVATIYADLLAGQCLRPQRQGGRGGSGEATESCDLGGEGVAARPLRSEI